MKSSYELAMERLSKAAPTHKLTANQKKEIAERELFVKGEIVKAIDRGDAEALEQLQKQLVSDRKSLQTELEEKKAKVWQGGN